MHYVTVTFYLGVPDYDPTASTFFTISYPLVTLPKTTCLPSNHGVAAVVKKNYDPLVLGPEFAIDRQNGSCFNKKFSSANFLP